MAATNALRDNAHALKLPYMKRKPLIIVLAIIVIAALGATIWYLSQPKNAAEQLEQARRIEARNSAQIAAKSTDAPRVAKLQHETFSAYAKVSEKYPKTPEAEDAEYRVMELQDAASTGPQARIALYEEFLKKHPTSKHAADLRWKSAEMTQKELKRQLDAIKLYEQFAKEFPKDERVAEARFRIATIYEEIREFPRAVAEYKKVAEQHPKSKLADEAQFKVGNLLAEKMEKKQEAAAAYEKLEKEHPQSRFAAAAGGERRKLAQAAAKSEGEKYQDDYYGGVKEVSPMDRAAAELNTPQMQRLRSQWVDLIHEKVRAEISPTDHQVSAVVEMQVVALAPTTSTFVMQLGAPLKVSSVKRGDRDAKYSKQDNFLFVDLEPDLQPGTTETFTLTYSGTNKDTWGGDIITSASTYLVHRNWVPVLNFGDVYTADIELTVPEGYTAISQGELVAKNEEAGKSRFTYAQKRPVYFYCAAAAPYETREAEYTSTVGGRQTRPLRVHLFKKTSPDYFDGYLKALPPILQFYEEWFGEFPFAKLSIAQVNFFPGGLGTPGLILIGDKAFDKPGIPAAFLAHEVAHTWFGNELTLDLSEDSIPWLSEGFANYLDAMYLEHRDGHDAFVRHMRQLAENYYTAVSTVEDKPIKGTLLGDPMYSSLAYDKGAFVLHALRGLLGSEKFRKLLRDYVAEHQLQVVTIADFQTAAERSYGAPLDWFFQQWLTRTGIPRYRVNVASPAGEANGQFQTTVEIEQLGDAYALPLDIEAETATGRERQRFDVKDAVTTVTMTTKAAPTKVMLDPEYWILKHPRTNEWEKPVVP